MFLENNKIYKVKSYINGSYDNYKYHYVSPIRCREVNEDDTYNAMQKLEGMSDDNAHLMSVTQYNEYKENRKVLEKEFNSTTPLSFVECRFITQVPHGYEPTLYIERHMLEPLDTEEALKVMLNEFRRMADTRPRNDYNSHLNAIVEDALTEAVEGI